MAPTVSPAPTTDVANAYNGEEGMCPSENALATTFQDGTGSYCVLFDVSPKVDLTVTGMDLNVSISCLAPSLVCLFSYYVLTPLLPLFS